MSVNPHSHLPAGTRPAPEPSGITAESRGFHFQDLRCPMGSCPLLASRCVGSTSSTGSACSGNQAERFLREFLGFGSCQEPALIV